jgi:hypothetical protein
MPPASPRCAAALALSLTALSPCPAARALPINYAGSTTIGVELDPAWSSAWFSHALDRHNGLGLSGHLLPARPAAAPPPAAAAAGAGPSRGQESYVLLDWTRLLRRWNLPNAQANIWLFAGLGGQRTAANGEPTGSSQAGGLRLAASPGLQVDIETTRLRFEARGRLLLAPGSERSLLSATAGVALTPARYQGVQPWLELQLRAMPGVTDGVELIPRLRLLHRRLVLDVGVGSRGSVQGGFSYTL